MSLIFGLLASAAIGLSGYFGALNFAEKQCEKKGYFKVYDNRGNIKKHVCE